MVPHNIVDSWCADLLSPSEPLSTSSTCDVVNVQSTFIVCCNLHCLVLRKNVLHNYWAQKNERQISYALL
jgi:hypothetical protein